MAQRTLIQLIDDLDGTVLEQGACQTIRFALDGRSYEIDLSDGNAAAFRAEVDRFITAGRKVAPIKPRRRRR